MGKVLQGRYEILEVIGIGGMATVYKAHCRLLNRYVAVKVLKESLNNDYEILQRFKTESRAAASLTHHNIVAIYDVGEEDGLNYIVMELVDGITLKEYISRVRYLPWKTACDFAMQIGLALQCAHENNIVHRDIKPHNILITKDFIVKVADFGIARAVTSDTLVTGHETMGSVRYISPEQARGGYVDARSDVYSLGVVLYEMLTGRVPFDGDNPVSIAMMKLNDNPISCRIINPDIPLDVEAITMKAIAREQHARYQSAMDMVTDLRTLLDGGTINNEAYDEERNQEEDNMSYQRRRTHTAQRKIKKKNKPSLKVIIATAVGAAVVLGLLVYALMSGGAKEVEVPEILGMTLDEAVSYVEEFGLEIDEKNIEYEPSDEYEIDQIMLQDPGAHQYMKQNKKIKITISTGDSEANIPMPDVTGKSFEDASEILEAKNLSVSRIDEVSESVKEGYVIRQSPSEGVMVSENTSVLLHVSSGSGESKEVPSVVGKTLQAAREAITSAGFKVSISEKESENDIGKVISQKPSEGSTAKEGDYITIVVGVEPEEEEPTATPTAKPTVTEAPTTPAPVTPTPEPVTRKTISIQIPETAGDVVQVKVVANGKVIHDAQHKKSEGTVDIPVEARNDATVEAYIDGQLVMSRVIEF